MTISAPSPPSRLNPCPAGPQVCRKPRSTALRSVIVILLTGVGMAVCPVACASSGFGSGAGNRRAATMTALLERRIPLLPAGRLSLPFRTDRPRSLCSDGGIHRFIACEDGNGAVVLFRFNAKDGLADGSVRVASSPFSRCGDGDFACRSVWLPVSTETGRGTTRILRVSAADLSVRTAFEVNERLDGLAVDGRRERIYAWNGTAHRWYIFDFRGRTLASKGGILPLLNLRGGTCLPSGDILVAGTRHGMMNGVALLSPPRLEAQAVFFTGRRTPQHRLLADGPVDARIEKGRLFLYFAPDPEDTHVHRFLLNDRESLYYPRLQEFLDIGGREPQQPVHTAPTSGTTR